MNKLKIDEIPWEEWQSPSGAFRGRFREISIAMGATRDGAPGAGGHPFDLALERLPPEFNGSVSGARASRTRHSSGVGRLPTHRYERRRVAQDTVNTESVHPSHAATVVESSEDVDTRSVDSTTPPPIAMAI